MGLAGGRSFDHDSHDRINLFCNLIQVRKLKVPTAKDMRHIDRKLKNCCDPSSQDEYVLDTFPFLRS